MSDEAAQTGPRGAGAPARRHFLRATVAGAAGLAAWSVTGGMRSAPARAATSPQGPAARILPFGTDWLFGPAAPESDRPGFDDSGLQPVTLPHTVTTLSWQEWDPASWEQVWVYRKHFDAPAQARQMRVFLDFGAAMTGSTVTLNGTGVGGRLGGYLPFSCELTNALQARDNVLALVLDSRFMPDVPPGRSTPVPIVSANVDWWQPGGIYREVWLRAVPQVFIADVFAKPVNVLDPAQRQVTVQVTVDAAVVPPGGAQIVIDLYDGPRPVASASAPVTISEPGQTTVTATLTGLAGITLWDIGNPKLYTVLATLMVAGRPVHEYGARTGFREASFQLDGFFLNGRLVKLLGLNRHQFFPFAGGAMSARVQARDAEILRNELNCTMVRCSHYPQDEAFYDACDELGLMVWEEAPGGGGQVGDASWQALVVRDVGDMITRDRNHPSVIIWGVRLNESTDDTALWTATNNLAHSLDDSRPTVGAMHPIRYGDPDYQQDVWGQNDYSYTTGPDGLNQPDLLPPLPGRPYLVSEAVGTVSGPFEYYRRTDPQLVQQSEAAAHARVHDIAFSDDRYCGVLAWSGYDYPSGNGSQYDGVKYTGVVDLFRIPKPGAAIYQAQVDPAIRPVIQPAFYWDFGPTSPVTSLASAMICSNLDRLEIYVGGAYYATVTPDTADYGNLPYPPSFTDFSSVDGSSQPELRIDGYLGSALVASQSLSSDPAGDRLSLAADDAELAADGADETRVVFRAVDEYGSPRPYVGGQVQLSVTGQSVLVGDNPFDFTGTGAAGAVWVRTLPGVGSLVTVRAAHPTLGSATVTIRVLPPAPGNNATPFAYALPRRQGGR